MTTMTPAQGRFLTALLDDLTAVAPAAGTEARARLHATFAAGNLTKAEASRSIDVVKRAITLATAAAPKTPALPERAISPREQALIDSRRANAAALNLTPGKRPAKRRSAPVRGGGVMDSLRSWTPERAAAALADRDGLPF